MGKRHIFNPDKEMRFILIVLAVCLFASCSYEKRLARAQRKLGNLVAEFPALVQHDTVYSIDTLRIEAKSISGEIELDKKYEKLDSLLALYSHDTMINKETITNTIKNYIINKPILLDTIAVDTIGIHFRLFERSGKLAWSINIDEQELIKKYATVVHSVNPLKEVYVTRWWDYVARVIALLALLFIIFDQLAARRK